MAIQKIIFLVLFIIEPSEMKVHILLQHKLCKNEKHIYNIACLLQNTKRKERMHTKRIEKVLIKTKMTFKRKVNFHYSDTIFVP